MGIELSRLKLISKGAKIVGDRFRAEPHGQA
jgi:hypothetical protein